MSLEFEFIFINIGLFCLEFKFRKIWFTGCTGRRSFRGWEEVEV